MELWLEMLLRERDAELIIERTERDVTVQAVGKTSGIRTDALSGDVEDEDLYIGQMLGELMVLEAKALEDRLAEAVAQAEAGKTVDRGSSFGVIEEQDPNELCGCGHAARAHTDEAGNCFALGVTAQESSHCLGFQTITRGTSIPDQIASFIRAELVCCDVYGRVNDREDLTDVAKDVLFKVESDRPGFHAFCFWGEASSRIAESFR